MVMTGDDAAQGGRHRGRGVDEVGVGLGLRTTAQRDHLAERADLAVRALTHRRQGTITDRTPRPLPYRLDESRSFLSQRTG